MKEIKYHLKCMAGMRNRLVLTTGMSQEKQNSNEKYNESRAFAELTSNIQKAVESVIPLFKLCEVH